MIKKRIVLLSILLLSIVIVSANNTKPDNEIVIPIATPLRSLYAPILVYHYVEYVTDERDTMRKSLNTPPHLLIKQIETLKNAGYTFVTMSELMEIMDGKIKLPNKPVVLSFDDGYRDFYTDVFPILKKYDVKAVVYVVSGFLDQPNYMFTEQVREISKSGLVEIGAHTVHHYALRGLDNLTAKYEIEESKKDLETLLNIPIVSFAYPDGSFDDQAQKLIREAGFRSAATTLYGYEINQGNKYSMYRIHPGNKTDTFLINFLK
ncbi:MAG: polysaccharide deacetylase family protein [Candidatus Levybacteria bacterium]|nr:polysaccharide deacetylase family protein [Candidatus Levybacteria bacterium]